MSCLAAQRWEMHVKSTGAPTRPSAALVALRAWAGINRKARHPKLHVVSTMPACIITHNCFPLIHYQEVETELCVLGGLHRM